MPNRLPLTAFTLLLLLAACASEPTTTSEPESPYTRRLPPGRSALRLITDPEAMPDIAGAFLRSDSGFVEALHQSLTWFAAPSSKQFFPMEGLEEITHDRARRSVEAMLDLVESSSSAAAFEAEVVRRFDVYQSVGWDGRGTILFTGYFSPIFKASRTRSAKYDYPLYKRPDDLVTDRITGEPLGRATPGGGLEPYFTRREIEESNMFSGSELVYLEDALSAYLIHVNGSAKLRLDDGTTMYIGYAGKTDRAYASLGKAMIEAGLLDRNRVSLSAIRAVYRRSPRAVEDLMWANESYVFFTEYAGDRWPAGSLGVRVTAERSVATDKSIYPRGGVVLVNTNAIGFSGESAGFLQFMMDQDTGGAIRAPGRADLYMGIGPSAEILAGGQYAEGQMYYFFVRESS